MDRKTVFEELNGEKQSYEEKQKRKTSFFAGGLWRSP